MAKDMKNVNNWHWTEKNCLPWAKTYFTEKLSAITVNNKNGTVKVNRVVSVEGDCDLNQRKKKILPMFDLKLSLEWSGSSSNGDSSVLGTLDVPEICHDSDSSDYVFNVFITGNDRSPSAPKLLELARQQLVDEVKLVILGFDRALIERHSKDVQIEPIIEQPEATPTPIPASTTTTSKASEPKKFDGSIRLEFDLYAPASDIYVVLTDAKLITVWSKCPATFVAAPGLPFKLFSSTIRGTVDSATKNKQLILKWRSEGWPEGHHSKVSINFASLPSKTKSTTSPKVRVTIVQSQIPSGMEELTERHWRDEVMGPILHTFDFGKPTEHLFLRAYKSTLSHPIIATAGLGFAASMLGYLYFSRN